MSVAYPFAPVRPETPGGAEQVLLSVDRALRARGHLTAVVAVEGSLVGGRLFPVPPVCSVITDHERERVRARCAAAVRAAVKEFGPDIVHMHGLDFDEYMPKGPAPVLATLHLPLSWYQPGALASGRPGLFFNCVSRSQAACAVPGTGPFGCVENGVDLDGRPEKLPGRYALSMGRVCPEKGFHLAMDAARSSGVPFILAGAVFRYREHEEYFRAEIAPRLGPRCRFIGPVGPERRKRLLAGAICLVAPSLAPETSSLAAMEAAASGTPVVAFGSGALVEIVEHNRTGFIAATVKEMARFIMASAAISPDECRKAAGERFSAEAMADRYLHLYREITGVQRQAHGRAR